MGALPLEAAFICCLLTSALAQAPDDEWKSATATFSKEIDASIETEGACGFGDLHKTRYGKYSAGLSGMLFNKGSSCGACFEVRCVDHNHKHRCLQGNPSVTLTATDFCPPNYALPADYGGWCNFPRAHFQIPEPAFAFLQVLVANVGLDGEVVAVKVKGSMTGWIPMGRNWGQNWQCNINLAGQPLSFEVTTAGRRTLASYNVAPPTWNFSQTFIGKQF